MYNVNLIRWRSSIRTRRFTLTILCTGISFAVAVAVCLCGHYKLQHISQQLHSFNQGYGFNKNKPNNYLYYRDLAKNLSELQRQYAIVKNIESTRQTHMEIINKLALLMPADVTLNSVEFTHKTLELSGWAQGQVAIAELFGKLKRLSLFSDLIWDKQAITTQRHDVLRHQFKFKLTIKQEVS